MRIRSERKEQLVPQGDRRRRPHYGSWTGVNLISKDLPGKRKHKYMR